MKKVMMLGLAHGMEEAPKDYDGEVWTCNDGAMRRTRKHGKPYITAMYNAHNLNVAELSEKQSALLCEAFNIPIYSVMEYPWLRNSHRMPRKEIASTSMYDVFSNVICYMIGDAIRQGFEQIDLWGVHLHPEQRDGQESAITHLWLGIAIGKGIKLVVKDYDEEGCAIMKNGAYWTGEGSYGQWDTAENLKLEAEARDNPRVPLEEVPTQEVKFCEK